MKIAEYLDAAAPWLPLVQPRSDSAWLAWVDVLAAAGVSVIEIPLRDAQALAGLKAVRNAFPNLVVAAGTVCSVADAQAALAAGAHFLVSPGVVPGFVDWTEAHAVAWLPGVATATDLLQTQRLSHPYRKFFPAAAIGGMATLQALAGPFPHIQFVPSGGLSPVAAATYLAAPNVCCVSASWDSIEMGADARSLRQRLQQWRSDNPERH